MTLITRIQALEKLKKSDWKPQFTKEESIWLSSFVYNHPDLFPPSEEQKSDPDFLEFLELSKQWDLYWHKKIEICPPIPVWLQRKQDEHEAEKKAWSDERGHEPTTLDILRKYQHLFEE